METNKPPGALLRATEVAARLGIDRRRVYELPIPRINLSPKCIRFDPDDVRDFIERRRMA
jgi:predicted DNA-binding transcriptional regulator AlpA